jgi:DNA-binding transcriptional ArsR family regulator
MDDKRTYMGLSLPSPAIGYHLDPAAEHVRRVEDETTIQALLEALNDPDCRDILDATSDVALTAAEVSETCDIPLSTTYRKLDHLTDAGLLEEGTRIRNSGKHTSEYRRLVESVIVSLTPSGETALHVANRRDAERIGSPAQ